MGLGFAEVLQGSHMKLGIDSLAHAASPRYSLTFPVLWVRKADFGLKMPPVRHSFDTAASSTLSPNRSSKCSSLSKADVRAVVPQSADLPLSYLYRRQFSPPHRISIL